MMLPEVELGRLRELALRLAHLPNIYLWDWYQPSRIKIAIDE
jgi:hypothetical protein